MIKRRFVRVGRVVHVFWKKAPTGLRRCPFLCASLLTRGQGGKPAEKRLLHDADLGPLSRGGEANG
jgi:hypothetical protein